MNVFIYTNILKADNLNNSLKLIDVLNKQSIKWITTEDLYPLLNQPVKHQISIDECDVMIVLGGDGTILKASKLAIKHNLKVLGINAGRLGYLCALKIDEIDKLSNEYINKLHPTQRTLVEFIHGKQKYYALNDVVIFKNHPGKTVELNVSISNGKQEYVRGDGLIVATPTGSTSYNFSTGGPVINYDVNALVINPICPHSGIKNPFVINDHNLIEISINNPLANDAQIIVDGDVIGSFDTSLKIKKSDTALVLLTSK